MEVLFWIYVSFAIAQAVVSGICFSVLHYEKVTCYHTPEEAKMYKATARMFFLSPAWLFVWGYRFIKILKLAFVAAFPEVFEKAKKRKDKKDRLKERAQKDEEWIERATTRKNRFNKR